MKKKKKEKKRKTTATTKYALEETENWLNFFFTANYFATTSKFNLFDRLFLLHFVTSTVFNRLFCFALIFFSFRRFGFKIAAPSIENRRSNCKRRWHHRSYHRAMEWCETFKDTAYREAISHIHIQTRLTDIHK